MTNFVPGFNSDFLTLYFLTKIHNPNFVKPKLLNSAFSTNIIIKFFYLTISYDSKKIKFDVEFGIFCHDFENAITENLS